MKLTQVPRRLLSTLVHGYRLLLKPWLGNACRFEPTCSAYALQALDQHGALRGTALTAGRILRCHPWCDGGLDPVPEHFSPSMGRGLFTRLVGRADERAASPRSERSLTRKNP